MFTLINQMDKIIILTLLVVSILTTSIASRCNIEQFSADGWVYNLPSEWYYPKEYEITDWFTPVNPDQLSYSPCLSYNRGDSGILNYNSYAYRLWKF